jgi:hypothetical protein
MSEPVPSNAEPRGAITFTYTEQDFVAAYQCEKRRATNYPKQLWSMTAFIVVFCILAAALIAAGGAICLIAAGFVIALVAALGFAAQANRRVCRSPAMGRRIFTEQQDAGRRIDVEWSATALRMASDLGHQTIPWPLFRRWNDDQNVFLLYRSSAFFYALPKRAFSPESAAAFTSLLAAKIQKAARGPNCF